MLLPVVVVRLLLTNLLLIIYIELNILLVADGRVSVRVQIPYIPRDTLVKQALDIFDVSSTAAYCYIYVYKYLVKLP